MPGGTLCCHNVGNVNAPHVSWMLLNISPQKSALSSHLRGLQTQIPNFNLSLPLLPPTHIFLPSPVTPSLVPTNPSQTPLRMAPPTPLSTSASSSLTPSHLSLRITHSTVPSPFITSVCCLLPNLFSPSITPVAPLHPLLSFIILFSSDLVWHVSIAPPLHSLEGLPTLGHASPSTHSERLPPSTFPLPSSPSFQTTRLHISSPLHISLPPSAPASVLCSAWRPRRTSYTHHAGPAAPRDPPAPGLGRWPGRGTPVQRHER